jgi:hypothetical protein
MVLLCMGFIYFIIEFSGQSGIVETVYITMMFFCEQRAYHAKHSADTTTKAYVLVVGLFGIMGWRIWNQHSYTHDLINITRSWSVLAVLKVCQKFWISYYLEQ